MNLMDFLTMIIPEFRCTWAELPAETRALLERGMGRSYF